MKRREKPLDFTQAGKFDTGRILKYHVICTVMAWWFVFEPPRIPHASGIELPLEVAGAPEGSRNSRGKFVPYETVLYRGVAEMGAAPRDHPG